MDKQQELFHVEPTEQCNLHSVSNSATCKDCKHRQRWQCNSKVFQYCGVRKSNITQNGLLKIKCKDKACHAFEHCC